MISWQFSRRIVLALTLLAAPAAQAQDKPRAGGVLTWFDYGDPGRLDDEARDVRRQLGFRDDRMHRTPDL